MANERYRAQLLPLLEPMPIDDDLCARLALIEDLGFGARFVLTADQTVYETGAHISAVKRKIVLPYAEIWPGVEMTLAFMARRGKRIAGQKLLKLVR